MQGRKASVGTHTFSLLGCPSGSPVAAPVALFLNRRTLRPWVSRFSFTRTTLRPDTAMDWSLAVAASMFSQTTQGSSKSMRRRGINLVASSSLYDDSHQDRYSSTFFSWWPASRTLGAYSVLKATTNHGGEPPSRAVNTNRPRDRGAFCSRWFAPSLVGRNTIPCTAA